MTDEPQEEATAEPADEPAGEPVSGPESVAAVEEARRATEQIRLAQDAHREDLEQLKVLLQGADGLTATTGDLLADFKQTAETLAAERQLGAREGSSWWHVSTPLPRLSSNATKATRTSAQPLSANSLSDGPGPHCPGDGAG